MNKWYEENVNNTSLIISSRVRLARNLKAYPFPIEINLDDSKKLIDDIKNSIINERTHLKKNFEFIDFDKISDIEKLSMMEKHSVSKNFLQSKKNKGLILEDNEKTSIMINEEDHIRIQNISYGENIDKNFKDANRIDDLMEESLKYAFSNEIGYLTSCPTNVGTGLRASYMVHLPALSKTKKFFNLINVINKFGMTIRGVFGEGTEPKGYIYQISNQRTLGITEEEIIENLKNITAQIIEHEKFLQDNFLQVNKINWEDTVYRSYGILQNARNISTEEAINLLSNIKLGYEMGLITENLDLNIYNIMINIRPGNLQKNIGKYLDEKNRSIERANYLRKIFNQKN